MSIHALFDLQENPRRLGEILGSLERILDRAAMRKNEVRHPQRELHPTRHLRALLSKKSRSRFAAHHVS